MDKQEDINNGIISLLEEMGAKRDGNKHWVNEFLLDILGALVPGVIFLFSIIAGIIIPLLLCFYPVLGKENNRSVTQIDLLISNVFQGWFWLVIFFTLLILAYAIGSIFHRLDIKDVDRKSFDRSRKEHFKTIIFPLFTGIFILRRNFFSVSGGMCKKRLIMVGKDKNKDNVCAPLLEEYFLIISSYLQSGKDRDWLKEIYSVFDKDEDRDENNDKDKNDNKLRFLNHLSYELYTNKGFSMENTDYIAGDRETSGSLWLWLKKEFSKECMDTSGNTSLLIKKINAYINEHDKASEQLTIIHCCFNKELGYGNAKKKSYSEFDRGDYCYLALGWCFIFSLRFEFACDSKENCQFPYAYYDKYLTKRNQNSLIEYVNWKDEKSRSKNGINQLKIELQVRSPKQYKILVKNEADIRMASSSWVAAGICLWPITAFGILFGLFILFRWFYFQDGLGDIIISSAVISCVLLGMVIALNIFIQKSVLVFIHYQRLREVFFTLQVYDLYKIGRLDKKHEII